MADPDTLPKWIEDICAEVSIKPTLVEGLAALLQGVVEHTHLAIEQASDECGEEIDELHTFAFDIRQALVMNTAHADVQEPHPEQFKKPAA